MNTKPTLTVFTPTYNRASLLVRGYEALKRQTYKDFVWLIIDDGSTDNTREIVNQWIQESIIPIRYEFKENGGLHTGYNKAIEVMDTELCVCIDSDDWMPDDAVETIIKTWHKYGNGSLAGIVGHDYYTNGEIIGNHFSDGKIIHYIKLKESKSYNFDNKVVMRLDLLKSVAPQPSFGNEKNFNPIWLMLKVDEKAPFVLVDKNLCFVEYQEGGMSYNLINQFFNSPNSFLELRKLYISLKYSTYLFRIKNHIHLIAQSLIAHHNPFRETNNKVITTLLYPIGFLLYIYMKTKHSNFNK